jgi:cation:H+ antiporter
VFVVSAVVIGVCGVLLTRRAVRIARHTGLGQAVTGAVFLGATTSLSGLVTSLTAAFGGHADLSVGNAVGGIAAQTTFLVVADILYRDANLEHAAASETNLLQAALLATLLTLPLVAVAAPDTRILGLNPVSLALIGVYVFGIRLIAHSHKVPMWRPERTAETVREPDASPTDRHNMRALWVSFSLLALIVAASGWGIARSALSIAARTGISESVLGSLFTAVSTSLPEFVIAVAAVRRGALTLAVGDIIGGNSFDVLFLALSDILFRGSATIYHSLSGQQVFWLAASLLMNSLLMMGLLKRQKHGFANIGFESVLVLLIYVGAVLRVVFWPEAGGA